MRDGGYLHRTWYRTDATSGEPQYPGAFSTEIPATALDNRQVVGVDWSRRGWVEVTFLIRGYSPTEGGDLPWPEGGFV